MSTKNKNTEKCGSRSGTGSGTEDCNRDTLKARFSAGKIPMQEDFGAMIDSMLNQSCDGIWRNNQGLNISTNVLTGAGPQSLLNLYKGFKSDPEGTSWKIDLDAPLDNTNDRKAGLNISEVEDGKEESRLFIEEGTGNVGINNPTPVEKLDIKGKIKCDNLIIDDKILYEKEKTSIRNTTTDEFLSSVDFIGDLFVIGWPSMGENGGFIVLREEYIEGKYLWKEEYVDLRINDPDLSALGWSIKICKIKAGIYNKELIAVGAPFSKNNRGCVIFFHKPESNWVQYGEILYTPDPEENEGGFGWSIEFINCETNKSLLLISSPNKTLDANNNKGCVYTFFFDESEGIWKEKANDRIYPEGLSNNAIFGWQIKSYYSKVQMEHIIAILAIDDETNNVFIHITKNKGGEHETEYQVIKLPESGDVNSFNSISIEGSIFFNKEIITIPLIQKKASLWISKIFFYHNINGVWENMQEPIVIEDVNKDVKIHTCDIKDGKMIAQLIYSHKTGDDIEIEIFDFSSFLTIKEKKSSGIMEICNNYILNFDFSIAFPIFEDFNKYLAVAVQKKEQRNEICLVILSDKIELFEILQYLLEK